MDNLSEGSHASRTRYEPAVYAKLLKELTALMEAVPKLEPDRNSWDIEGDWSATGTLYFVEKQYQLLFEKIRNFDCRSIKLVNMDRPAMRMTFFKRHRYWLLRDKDLPIDEKQRLVGTYLAELRTKEQRLEDSFDQLPLPKRLEATQALTTVRQQLQQWNRVEADLAAYEMAVSNYSRQYVYVTLNYKFRLATGELSNTHEHLLNHQRDRLGNLTQKRYNIIFVDGEEILREHPYQNREVEGFLATFGVQSEGLRNALYARLRPVAEEGTDQEAEKLPTKGKK